MFSDLRMSIKKVENIPHPHFNIAEIGFKVLNYRIKYTFFVLHFKASVTEGL